MESLTSGVDGGGWGDTPSEVLQFAPQKWMVLKTTLIILISFLGMVMFQGRTVKLPGG